MDITTLDFALLDAISEKLSSHVLDKVMTVITYTGNAGAVWIVLTILCLIFKKTRRAGVNMTVALAVGMLIGGIFIKIFVARLRPFELNEIQLIIPQPLGSSFPSGHTLAGFLTATALFLHHRSYGIIALLYASLIGLSRLYLYVHFPSDVLAGAALGIIVAAAVCPASHHLYEWLSAFIERKRKHG